MPGTWKLKFDKEAGTGPLLDETDGSIVLSGEYLIEKMLLAYFPVLLFIHFCGVGSALTPPHTSGG